MSNGTRSYEKATVSADFLTRQLSCYSNGTAWNQFGCPAFAANDLVELVEELRKTGTTVSINQDRSLVLENEFSDVPSVIEISTIDVDGTSIEVYDFSFLGWTFDPCEPERKNPEDEMSRRPCA